MMEVGVGCSPSAVAERAHQLELPMAAVPGHTRFFPGLASGLGTKRRGSAGRNLQGQWFNDCTRSEGLSCKGSLYATL